MHWYLYHQHHGTHSLPSQCKPPSFTSVDACKELWGSISSQTILALPSCPSFAAYMWHVAFTDNVVYNGWKQTYLLQHPPASAALVFSKRGFPTWVPHLSNFFFFGCGEVTAPCWLWFPLLKCWWYFILQMRHFINHDEDKELLQAGEGGTEGGEGGRAECDCADKSSTLLNLFWQRKKTNIREVMLQFSTITLSFSFAGSK